MLSLNVALAQCPILPVPTDGFVSIVDHFGACPDDEVNDHDAFVRAALYFNARNGEGVLRIPAGEYIVGRQIDVPDPIVPGWLPDATPGWIGGNSYAFYKHLLALNNCSNMRIRGEVDAEGRPASKIRFKDCMRYGLFDPNYTGPGDMRFVGTCAQLNAQSPNAGAMIPFQANVGQMIVLTRCANILIQDLELDGNSGKYTLGGPSDQGAGIQLHSDGIRLGGPEAPSSANTNVTIRNVNAHHFGRDGLTLTQGSEAMNLLVEDCHFDHNGRTGFAWTSGTGLTVVNSTFDHNATARIRSRTASGLDIEYHNDAPVPADGTFTQCSFEFNLRAGVSSGPVHVAGGVTFEDCTFKSLAARYDVDGVFAPSSYSIEAPAPWLQFLGCEFYGPALVGFNSVECEAQDGDAQQFIGCTFSEEDGVNTFYDWRFTDFTNQVAPSMVLGNNSSGTVFERCRFISNCRARFLDINGGNSAGCTPCVNDVVIKDCRFRNTGLWAGENENSVTMFSLTEASWFNSTINLHYRVRLQEGGVLPGLNSLAYFKGGPAAFSLSTCQDLLAGLIDRIGADTPESGEAFFAAHPCLPVLPEPPIPLEVIGCQDSVPIRELVDEYACVKRVKSAPPLVKEGAMTTLVHHGSLNVQVPGTSPIRQALIVDATGKVAGRVSLSPGANEVPVDHLAVGTYHLHWEGASSPIRFVIMP
jgi:hypothetical protein